MNSRRLAIWLAIVGVIAVAVGLLAWGYTGPAQASPGMSCNPEPGHGTPGCHVAPTTTTAQPTTTTAKPTTTTVKPTTTTAKPTGTTGTTAKPTTTTAKPGTPTTSAPTSTTGTSASTTTASSTTTTGATTTAPPTTGATPSTTGEQPPVDLTGEPRYEDAHNCLSCHGDPGLAKTMEDGSTVSLFVDTSELPQAVHRYQDCTVCHTTSPHDVESPHTKLSQAEKCGTCHDYQYKQHMNSVHGIPLAGGNTDPATCADCHSNDSNPHNVVRVLEPEASTYPKNIADTCAKCHNDPALMDKYGIVEKVYDSYMRSFHGKAIKLSPENATIQQLDTATCVNCHGVHNIKSTRDPASPVGGMDNLLKTCQLCHSQAGPEFVKSFLGHKVANADYFPQVYWGGTVFYVITRGVLGVGVLIVATSLGLRGVPWVRGKLRRRDKREE